MANSFRSTLKSNSAIAHLQRGLAEQEREVCHFAGTNGRQVQGLRAGADDVAKGQRQDRTKVFGLQKAIWAVGGLIEGVKTKLSETDDAVGRRVGPLELEQITIGLPEVKDRVESDGAVLEPAMADRRAKAEEVRRKVANLKAQLSKVNQGRTSIKQELGKLKEEMREPQELNVLMTSQQLRDGQEILDLKHEVELLRNASDGQRESQEQEAVGSSSGLSGWNRRIRAFRLEDERTEIHRNFFVRW